MGLFAKHINYTLVPGPASSTAHFKKMAPSYLPKPWQPMSLKFLIKLLSICLLISICIIKLNAQQQYKIHFIPIDNNATVYIKKYLSINTLQTDSTNINSTLKNLINNAKQRGYYGASIDSTNIISDSLFVHLYIGQALTSINIEVKKEDQAYFNAIIKNNNIAINPLYWDTLSLNLLNKLANNGYPFAQVKLQNFGFDSATNAIAQLQINKSIKYKIDSIVFADTTTIISKSFLQKYLGFKANTYYSNNLINDITTKINNLPYLSLANTPQLNLLNTGAYLTLNLKNKAANSINALLGLVPNNNANASAGTATPVKNNYSLIGQASAKLWNILGSGEYIALQFEQLIAKHPRLHIETKIPYILKSNFPLNFTFDLYRRDTLFLNLSASISTSYNTSKKSTFTLGLQWNQSNTVGLNLNTIVSTKQLPNYIDSRFYGILAQYDYNKITNVFYPKNIGDLTVSLNGGTRLVKKNNEILNLKDPLNPTFNFAKLYDTVANNAPQIKWTAYLQHYVSLKKLKVLKCALRLGALVSNKVFFNEQFLLGGIKTLRGFDEESQPASLFSIGTLEYRIPAGSKAYLALFTEGAWMRNSTLNISKSILFGSAGAGITINGKGGLLNFTIANGVRSNDIFTLKRTKVHIGYEINF